MMINVGGMYQPLTFYATGWRGDFVCYISHKEIPTAGNCDLIVENDSSFKYPRGMDHTRPEALRFKHEKLIYLVFEASEDCALTLAVYQNNFIDIER